MGNDNVKDYPPYLDYPKPRKTITNADRIRAMTDEELAEFLWRVWTHDREFYRDCVENYAVPFFKWLRQEGE